MAPSFLEKLKQQIDAEVPTKKEPPKIVVEKKREKKELKKKEMFKPEEAQLAIDVCQTNSEIVIITPIAKVRAEDLDISIENDVVTIKGKREAPEEEKEIEEFLYQECHWGPFSRQVILPEEVDISRTVASLKEGVLILKIPKIQPREKRKIMIKEIKSE